MDEQKELFEKFSRSFIVLQDFVKYDEENKCFLHRHVCHKQLVGADDAAQEAGKKLLEEIKGEWETKPKYFTE